MTIAVAFMAFDAVGKLLRLPQTVTASTALRVPDQAIQTLGVVELVCLVAYLVPRTRVVGAVLFTGYLGGAVATHVIAGSPLGSHVLFPTYVAVLLWLPLYLRDARVRALLTKTV